MRRLPGPPRGGMRGASINRRPVGRPAIHPRPINTINLSESSSYDYESDDLPIIKTRPVNNQNSKFNIHEDYSSEYDYSYSIKETPTKRKTGANLYSDHDYSDSFDVQNPIVTESHPPENESQTQNTNKNNQRNTGSQNWSSKNQNNIAENANTDPNTNISVEVDELPPQNSLQENNNNSQNTNNQPQNAQTRVAVQNDEKAEKSNQLNAQNEADLQKVQPQVSDERKPISPENVIDGPHNPPCYRIIWKRSGRLKSNIQMVFNDEILFHSKEGKTDIGKCHIICSDTNIDRYSKSYLGSLKKSQNLTRFTLFAPQGEEYQTHEGEVMGLSFYDPKEVKSYGVRAFRIAFPKKQPYFPSSKKMNLSKIAQNNLQSDDFTIFQTKLPELLPGPILKLQFGNVHVISSVKNFILEDENNNVIFMIYKSSSGMCSVRISPPITPLVAFCISIAVITSNK